jgi:thiol-disulfide isomerase/thioredoxin
VNSFGLIALVAVLVAATVFGLWRRRVDGAFRVVDQKPSNDDSTMFDIAAMPPPNGVLSADVLGAPLGRDATLVEFSSAFCAHCRATRRVLDKVVADVDGVALIEIDAEQHLELTRELSILRTPTVLVLDAAGRIKHRASGQPRYADVVAALGSVVSSTN